MPDLFNLYVANRFFVAMAARMHLAFTTPAWSGHGSSRNAADVVHLFRVSSNG